MRRRAATVLYTALLAGCVAAASAVPNEEWAQRMEARLEQSEQTAAALKERVAFLEGEVQRLRPRKEEAEPTARTFRTRTVPVGPMGEPEAVGRRLSAPTCCRWTADGTCGSVAADRLEPCTLLHEYLESKTTTHEFSDVDTCLGADESRWSFKYDGASTNQLTLSNGANTFSGAVTLKTPLKVTHAADCNVTAPTLNVQMDTVHDGTFTLGGATVESAVRLLVGAPTSSLASYTFGSTAWTDVTPLQATPTLNTYSGWNSSLLLVQYQISYGIVGAIETTHVACRLMMDGVEVPDTRSMQGGTYGTVSSLWIGRVYVPQPAFKVQCRQGLQIAMNDDYEGMNFNVLVLG